jgi:hypothetical protein
MSANLLHAPMLPCPFKAMVGVDCPGCGIQRAWWALLNGDFADSWHHYPPLLPFLFTLLLIPFAVKSKFTYRMHFLAASIAVTCIFIATNYVFKVIGPFQFQ